MDGLHLSLPDALWRPVGYNNIGEAPDVRLTLTTPLFINGVGHHVHAALLEQDEYGALSEFRDLADAQMEAEVMAGLQMIHEGRYEPTVICGKPYVVYMTPFAD